MAITPDLRQQIIAAHAGALLQALPAGKLPDRETEVFMVEIAAFMSLTGGGWPPEQRQEFIDQAAIDLADYPASLLAPAIRNARRKVWSAARFVSWIVEAVELDNAKLQTELARLNRLGEIAFRDE